MSLDHPTTRTALTQFATGNAALVVKGSLNSNATQTTTNDDGVQSDLEDTADEMHGRGVASGEFSVGSGLQIDNTALVVVVGRQMSIAAGNTVATASLVNSPFYVGNDGAIYADTPPASQDYVKVGEYTSSGAAVTSVVNMPSIEKKVWGADQILCHDNEVLCLDNNVLVAIA